VAILLQLCKAESYLFKRCILLVAYPLRWKIVICNGYGVANGLAETAASDLEAIGVSSHFEEYSRLASMRFQILDPGSDNDGQHCLALYEKNSSR
jgi:hypothetical protein